MQLHRRHSQPDWELVAPAQRNRWQRVAAASRGWLTPGNVITLAGLALVIIGAVALARHHYFASLLLIAFGRVFDLLDGLAAERTGTKCYIGEGLDAGADKLGGAAALAAFFMAYITPWWIPVLFLVPNLIIALYSLWANLRHRALHPSVLGKIDMALVWLCLGAYLVLATVQPAGSAWQDVLNGASVITGALGLYAAARYLAGRD